MCAFARQPARQAPTRRYERAMVEGEIEGGTNNNKNRRGSLGWKRAIFAISAATCSRLSWVEAHDLYNLQSDL